MLWIESEIAALLMTELNIDVNTYSVLSHIRVSNSGARNILFLAPNVPRSQVTQVNV